VNNLKDRHFQLAVTGITKKFAHKTLWSNLSFITPSGALTAITGVSGSGKTTLLNCIGLLEDIDDGAISYGDLTVTAGSRSSTRAFFRDTVGFLFQNYGLVEPWTVRQNLLLPLKAMNTARSDRNRAIDDALTRVGMRGREKERIYTLSGGEQQRIAMAQLILKAPSLILADEPTSALDHGNAELVMDILADQAAHGALVLISTHNDDIVRRCDHIVPLPLPGSETLSARELDRVPRTADLTQ
jgi:putative ABC transport system ATP-binding protein